MDPNGRPSRSVNASTRISLEQPRHPAPDLRHAYTLACGIARMRPDALSGRAGHRLIWVRAEDFGQSILFAEREAYAIAGRHTQCSLVFPDDPSVALRHLLVRSVVLPSGSLAARILDLHTDIGFSLPNGAREGSVFAEGPVAITIGGYALVALPSDGKHNELPRELPAPEIASWADGWETPQHQPSPSSRECAPIVPPTAQAVEPPVPSMGPYRANARPNGLSRITLMPRLVMLGERVLPNDPDRRPQGEWSITLERDGRFATMPIGEQDLVGGVLIGRSEKCHSEALRRITHENTSRVHILILREGPEIVAYDLASTHGTFKDGLLVQRVSLGLSSMVILGSGPRAVRMIWSVAGR